MNQIDNFWVLGDNRINPFEFPVRFDQSGQGSNGLVKYAALCYDFFAFWLSL